jgi:hypothetical protein
VAPYVAVRLSVGRFEPNRGFALLLLTPILRIRKLSTVPSPINSNPKPRQQHPQHRFIDLKRIECTCLVVAHAAEHVDKRRAHKHRAKQLIERTNWTHRSNERNKQTHRSNEQNENKSKKSTIHHRSSNVRLPEVSATPLTSLTGRQHCKHKRKKQQQQQQQQQQ